jgi:hypothetical protein
MLPFSHISVHMPFLSPWSKCLQQENQKYPYNIVHLHHENISQQLKRNFKHLQWLGKYNRSVTNSNTEIFSFNFKLGDLYDYVTTRSTAKRVWAIQISFYTHCKAKMQTQRKLSVKSL